MSHISGNGWRVKGFLFLVFLLWVFFSNTFLCYFCANFCAIFVLFLCKFLCDFCAILFIFLCKILSKFLCGSIKGTLVGWDVLSLARLFGATFMELWNYGIMELWNIQLLCWDWIEHAKWGGRSNTLFGAACRVPKTDALWGLPFRKNWRFFCLFFFRPLKFYKSFFIKLKYFF